MEYDRLDMFSLAMAATLVTIMLLYVIFGPTT